jgi:hypothetical protein
MYLRRSEKKSLSLSLSGATKLHFSGFHLRTTALFALFGARGVCSLIFPGAFVIIMRTLALAVIQTYFPLYFKIKWKHTKRIIKRCMPGIPSLPLVYLLDDGSGSLVTTVLRFSKQLGAAQV